jgi:hypothetical protein
MRGHKSHLHWEQQEQFVSLICFVRSQTIRMKHRHES